MNILKSLTRLIIPKLYKCRCGKKFYTFDELNDHWDDRECFFWT